ncbi:MAG: 16S rRNA (uracil(1498)-N(3))-methyltransferase [Nitrospiraceae bacterium]|nr:16S rRNA (uracil(1498)-N(3))-methyltransferase [Nitrospiraceae bacterium]
MLPQKISSLLFLTLVGPEGGWSKEELRMAEQAGIEGLAPAPHLLRAETAAIVTSASPIPPRQAGMNEHARCLFPIQAELAPLKKTSVIGSPRCF